MSSYSACSRYLNNRLQDVVHSEKRIYLVFEYLDLDLKKYMDSCPELAKDPRLIKVSSFATIKQGICDNWCSKSHRSLGLAMTGLLECPWACNIPRAWWCCHLSLSVPWHAGMAEFNTSQPYSMYIPLHLCFFGILKSWYCMKMG